MLHMLEPTGWTEGRLEQLKVLWAEGQSAAVIAATLGGGLTRNAVIGKVHRMKLPPRYSVTSQTHAKPRMNRNNGKGQPKAAAIRHRVEMQQAPAPKVKALPISDELPDVTSRIGFDQMVHDKTCRWINGDPLAEHSYCPNPRKGGSSWCEHHHRRVYPARAALS